MQEHGGGYENEGIPCIATQHQSPFQLEHCVETEVKTACMALHMLHTHTTRNL